MKIIECTNIDFEHEDESFTVSSHETTVDGNRGTVVRLLGPGYELVVIADSRGAGILWIGDHLRRLGLKLNKVAFEQEGVVRSGEPK